MKNIRRIRLWLIVAIVSILFPILAWLYYVLLDLQENWGPL